MKETWRWVPDYEGFYTVSSLGRVISHRYGRELTPTKERYKKVSLAKNGKSKSCSVHDIVCRAFLGKRPDGYVIHHKDNNKWNNAASNLEYVTLLENSRRARLEGKYRVGEKHPAYKHGWYLNKTYPSKPLRKLMNLMEKELAMKARWKS